jgi:hypothetical protein
MFLEGVCCVEDASNTAKPTTLPTELLDLIIQFALLHADSDTTSLGLFATIAPFSLASTQFRSLALRRKTFSIWAEFTNSKFSRQAFFVI